MNNQNDQQNNLEEKEKKRESAEKAGALAADAALTYLSGGKSKQLEKVPIVGNQLKKAEKDIGKKVANLDEKTGGNLGRAAKKLDDAGALDAAQKGLDMLGSSMAAGSKNNAQSKDNVKSSENKKPQQNPQQKPQSNPNFAKNGLSSDGSDIVENDRAVSSINKGLSDIFNRKNEANSSSGSNSSSSKSENSFEEETNDDKSGKLLFKLLKNVVISFVLPGVIIMSVFLLMLLMLVSGNSDNDLAAVDPDNNQENATQYYSNDPDVKKFFDRVLEVQEEYSKDGKSINAMYITATYHVALEYNLPFSAKKMTKEVICKLADGMLGGSTVYSEDTYRNYLENQFFSEYLSEKQSKKATDRVFEYIEQYEEKTGKNNNKCVTTSNGECSYQIAGVHGYNTGALDITNLKVRLMSSSFCNGTDNVALKEDLVPFEKYVLGVTYGEIGQAFNTEVEKVHMIAARSFALARPYIMNGASGVKYVKEGNQNILQLRACVADQVYCNTDLGCSKDVPAGNQYGVVYSGTSHQYVYKQPLAQYNSTLISSWNETMGMIGVDKDKKVVEMGYAVGNGNKDDWVWKRWAESGMDYVQIILSAYPEIKEIIKANCNSSTTEKNSSFLSVTESVWKKLIDGNFTYTQGNSVPPSNTIDCSTFVSWVLYEYGYKEEFGGPQHSTVSFVNTNWSDKFGWSEISVQSGENVTNKLKPGDILVRDNGGGNNGHIVIISEVKSNGTILGYEVSSNQGWKNTKNYAPVDLSYFASYQWAGKIIRVSNISGDNCKTAESGDWMSWRQYSPAPWANIKLGNSTATIGAYGCFVTSIAIQIARSNAQTTIADFNPGTFVQQLNKLNGFNSSGNFIATDQALKTIVPSFSTVAHGVRLPNDKSGKIKVIQDYINQGYYVILRVKSSGQHWVAVTGTTNNGIQMVDPGSDATSVWDKYAVSESSTINVYKIG